jgi:hypothetical protein
MSFKILKFNNGELFLLFFHDFHEKRRSKAPFSLGKPLTTF